MAKPQTFSQMIIELLTPMQCLEFIKEFLEETKMPTFALWKYMAQAQAQTYSNVMNILWQQTVKLSV